ncbi:MAG: hypothetical protein ACK5M3_13215 [Dysgonomonas sp.]
MKKGLFTICFLTVVFWSFSTESASASTGDFDDVSTIPPIIIRPPANKQKLADNNEVSIHKSTFVDVSFEL